MARIQLPSRTSPRIWSHLFFEGRIDYSFYTAIDKYRPAPGRHVSDVVSATLSLRPIRNFDVRLLWHRIVTDYNRDADILLWGVGYRF